MQNDVLRFKLGDDKYQKRLKFPLGLSHFRPKCHQTSWCVGLCLLKVNWFAKNALANVFILSMMKTEFFSKKIIVGTKIGE
jgi:hypothetical protein